MDQVDAGYGGRFIRRRRGNRAAQGAEDSLGYSPQPLFVGGRATQSVRRRDRDTKLSVWIQRMAAGWFGSHRVLVEVRLPRRAKYPKGGYSIC